MSNRQASEGGPVEIWFKVDKDQDGYPDSVDWETLSAVPSGRGYKLTSIPFYIKNVSKGDVVSVTRDGEGPLEFRSVLERGGHSTLRVLVRNDNGRALDRLREQLQRMGAFVDEDLGYLVALDVPPSADLSQMIAYLVEGRDKGFWEIQAGFLVSA